MSSVLAEVHAVSRDGVPLTPGLGAYHVTPRGSHRPGVVRPLVVSRLVSGPGVGALVVPLGDADAVFPLDTFACEAAALAEARRLIEDELSWLAERALDCQLHHANVVSRQLELAQLYPFPLEGGKDASVVA